MSRFGSFWHDVWEALWAQDLDLIAAGVAFYGLFSIFPALAALIAIFSIWADPAVVESQLALMREFIPGDVYALFNSQISRLLRAGATTLGWASFVSLAVALWSARLGVGALIRGINAIHRSPARNGLRHLLATLTLTLGVIGMALVALAAVVVAPIALAFLPPNFPGTMALEVLRWCIGLMAMLFSLAALYRFSPSRRVSSQFGVPVGAALVVILWLGVSALFSTYVSNFGRYNEIYGSIGAVIALLLWFYVTAYLILLGAVFNVALSKRGAA